MPCRLGVFCWRCWSTSFKTRRTAWFSTLNWHYQVAPAELEAVALAHPALADVAVVRVPDEEAGEVPKAFAVLKPGEDASEADVIDYVAERVAPYKKIRRVEFVEAIPKTASGKILRRELMERG